ncbi:MAG: hypothetical protein AABX39_04540, partial [Nanoarchaeota archaeon]
AKEYNFTLTEEHWNAVKYAEGEKDDYSPGKRTSSSLAAFVHLCDSWSARGWYDCPITPYFNNSLQIVKSGEYTEGQFNNESNVLQYIKENDEWTGAKRSVSD